MKIIHTSDIHLDAAMQRGLSPEKARIRRNELMRAFLQLAEYAQREGASAVIVAGDFFDRGEVTAKVRRFVLDTVKQFSDIQFFILFGNHDSGSFSFSDELPQNLKLFDSEWKSFELENGICIGGVELTGDNFERVYGELKLDADKTNIVVMHGAVGKLDGEDNVNIKKLGGKEIDYLALGHYHSYETGKLDRRGIYCYSGCLEGRGFDECGDKGFVEISVDSGKLTHRFIKNSIRKVVEVPVNMTGAVSFFEQKERISEALSGISEDSMVRVRAEGALRPREEKFFDQIARELSEKYFVFEIKDRTKILVDSADYEGDLSLKGEFIRLVTDTVKNEDERNKIIACGLSALLGGDL